MRAKYGAGSLPNRYGRKTAWWAQQTPEYKAATGQRLAEGTRVFWRSLSDAQRAVIIQKRTRVFVRTNSSKTEERVAVALRYARVKFRRQKWIAKRSFDFLIPSARLLVEVNGDFWHACPRFFSANDVLRYPAGPVVASEIWQRDAVKNDMARSYGYRVAVVWEYLINSLTERELALKLGTLVACNA